MESIDWGGNLRAVLPSCGLPAEVALSRHSTGDDCNAALLRHDMICTLAAASEPLSGPSAGSDDSRIGTSPHSVALLEAILDDKFAALGDFLEELVARKLHYHLDMSGHVSELAAAIDKAEATMQRVGNCFDAPSHDHCGPRMGEVESLIAALHAQNHKHEELMDTIKKQHESFQWTVSAMGNDFAERDNSLLQHVETLQASLGANAGFKQLQHFELTTIHRDDANLKEIQASFGSVHAACTAHAKQMASLPIALADIEAKLVALSSILQESVQSNGNAIVLDAGPMQHTTAFDGIERGDREPHCGGAVSTSDAAQVSPWGYDLEELIVDFAENSKKEYLSDCCKMLTRACKMKGLDDSAVNEARRRLMLLHEAANPRAEIIP